MRTKPVERWLGDLRSWWPRRRRAAAESLGWAGDGRALQPLLDALLDRNAGVRMAAATALGELDDRQAIEPLLVLLGDPDAGVRQAAARALTGSGSVRHCVQLLRRLAEGDGEWDGLASSTDVKGAGLLAAALPLNGAAAQRLVRALDSVVEWLIERLNESSGCAGRIAALQDLGDPRAIEPLVHILAERDHDEGSQVAGAARTALRSMGLERAAPPLARAYLGRLDAPVGETWPSGQRYSARTAEIGALLVEGGDTGVDALLHALDPADPRGLAPAARLLREFTTRAVGDSVLRFVRDGGVQRAATLQALVGRDPSLTGRLIEAWSVLPPTLIRPLHALLRHPAPWIRFWAAEAVGRSRRTDAAPVLLRLWEETAGEDPLPAAVGLAYLGLPQGVQVLAAALENHDREARLAAAHALLRLGAWAGAALPALYRAQASEPDVEVREVCGRAVRAIESALRGGSTELEAASPPAGTGSELEAAPARGVRRETWRGFWVRLGPSYSSHPSHAPVAPWAGEIEAVQAAERSWKRRSSPCQ